ncbi:MAG: DMT family transporter [Alphaproteobacteria bacterium]|nr:DMT family transporter [Alphaproteobacteria bacterium]
MIDQASSPWQRTVALAGPAIFVLLWGTGFVGAKAGLQHSEPMTFLSLRFLIVAVLMAAIARAAGIPWPRAPGEIGHLAVLGLLMQFAYFGGCWLSIHWGVGAGISAVICALQPVMTAVLAGPLLGERVSARQWLGLGLGLIGVALVVSHKLGEGLGTPAAMAMSFVGAIGVTAGTLYQKRFCPTIDPRTGSAIQFIVAGLATGLVGLATETGGIDWHPEFFGALLYTSVFVSLISVTLLTLMIRQSEATRVASLFFLMPPAAAVVAYFYFGETITGLALVGMGVAVAGVALAVWRPASA